MLLDSKNEPDSIRTLLLAAIDGNDDLGRLLIAYLAALNESAQNVER